MASESLAKGATSEVPVEWLKPCQQGSNLPWHLRVVERWRWLAHCPELAFALAVREGGLLYELLWGVDPHAIPKRRAAKVAGLSPSPLAPALGVTDGRRAASACCRYTRGHVSWLSKVKKAS